MNKSWMLALLAALALSGCAMNKADKSTAGTFDRDQAMQEVIKEIESIGFERQEIVPGIDGFLNSSSALLERQHKVLGEYRTVAESHTDVQAFLVAHGANVDNMEAIQKAISEFDAGAENDNEKIGPKLQAYKAATKKISDANINLASELIVELAASAIILSQYSQEVVQATAGSLMSSFSKNNSNEPNIGSALLRAKKQLEVANKANKIIDADQQTIAAIDALEKELSGKG